MFNRNWNENHIANWQPELELNSNGFSGFQIKLVNILKELLSALDIKFEEVISEHSDLVDNLKTVKMIELSLLEFTGSKIWIYHDMAEYNILEQHRIYEEWGYLSPGELQKRISDNIHKALIIK